MTIGERVKDGISYGEHNPTGKCRECGGPNYGKYAVCQACIRKHPTPKAHDRSRLHAALDAVLDSARAKDAQSLTTPVEFVANYFDRGKWMGYMSGSSKADATMLARWLVDSEHHDSSNVENRAGTVVFTYRKK